MQPNGLSKENINAILAFEPHFQIQSQQKQEPFLNGMQPGSEQHSLVVNFISTLNKEGFTITFDWNAWLEKEVVNIHDPGLLANADLETLRKLITAHIRMNRFVTGHLDKLIAQGYFTDFLARLRAVTQL